MIKIEKKIEISAVKIVKIIMTKVIESTLLKEL